MSIPPDIVFGVAVKNAEQTTITQSSLLNRVKQILELKDKNYQKIQEILSLSVIQCLEDILKIEGNDVRVLYNNLKVLVEYLAHINEFIANSAQQVLLGDVIIDVASMNKSITTCVAKIELVIKKHQGFFNEYNELQDIVETTSTNIQESLSILVEIFDKISQSKHQETIESKAQKYNHRLQMNLEQQIFE